MARRRAENTQEPQYQQQPSQQRGLGANHQQQGNSSGGFNRQGSNNGGFNRQNTQQGNNNNNDFKEEPPKKGGGMWKVIVGVAVAVVVVGGGLYYYHSSSSQAEQQQQVAINQQKQAIQQQQQAANKNVEEAVMSIKTFNNKTSGFIPIENLVTTLKGQKVPASTSFSNISGSTRYITFTKGRVMLAAGHMFCYIYGEESGGTDGNMENASPFIQQIPYSMYAQLPPKGAVLAKVEQDTNAQGNLVTSFVMPDIAVNNQIQKIQQEEAQKQMQQQFQQQQSSQKANLAEVNNS